MMCLLPQALCAQVKKDSVVHSPTKAWLMSAALPGLGQAYNERYWKIPLIYGGFVAFGYFIQSNNFRYKLYRNAYDIKYEIKELEANKSKFDEEQYKDQLEKLEAKVPAPFKNAPLERLQYYKTAYRRDRDFYIILTSLFYILNMVDAAVDAHFFTYDISNDLSLNVQPYVNQNFHASQMKPAVGLNFSITF